MYAIHISFFYFGLFVMGHDKIKGNLSRLLHVYWFNKVYGMNTRQSLQTKLLECHFIVNGLDIDLTAEEEQRPSSS